MHRLTNIAPIFLALLLTHASPCVAGDNTVGGTAAGDGITTGTDNTILGTGAGVSITTGTDNTLLGYESGLGVTGSHNIILGEDPSSAITTGSSNILIGNSLTSVTNSNSHQLDIGDVITATGIGTPSAAVLNLVGTYPEIGGSPMIFSGGQLQRGGSTTLSYCPYKGNLKTTASQGVYAIPSGCLTATITSMYKGGTSGQSLSASTLYYIYLWNDSGTWVLDAETTGHTTNTTNGVEQMSGDSTKTLVGMVYPQSGPVLTDSTSARLVATWDNRTPKYAVGTFSVARSTTSATLVEINAEIETGFLTWGDAYNASYAGTAYNSTANDEYENGVYVDGIAEYPALAITAAQNSIASGRYMVGIPGSFASSEGHHYITLFGAANGGGTANWNASGGLIWCGVI